MFKIYESDVKKNITISTYDYNNEQKTEIRIDLSIKWLPYINIYCVENYNKNINYTNYLKSEEYKNLLDYTLNKLEIKFNEKFAKMINFIENTSKIDLTKLPNVFKSTDIENFSKLTDEDVYVNFSINNYNGKKILVNAQGIVKKYPDITSKLEKTFVTDFSYEDFINSPHRKNIINELIKNINNKILNIIKSSIIFLDIHNKRTSKK